jgi:transcription antitermination protein NusB
MKLNKLVPQRVEALANPPEEDARSGDPRRDARELAMQFLYQLDAQQGANLEVMNVFLNEYASCRTACEMAGQFIRATWKNINKIDEMIRAVSLNWDFNRISPVDRSNLRLAVHQLLACPEIPPKVVINEAVELAKRYSTAQAPAFVNGVLDVIMKQIQNQNTKIKNVEPPGATEV